MAKRVLFLLVVAAALIAALWFSQQRAAVPKVSGFVEANEIRIGSRVGGRVQAVHIHEGQFVQVGELLVELEPFDLLERLAEVQARRAQSQARLDRMMVGFRPEEIAQAQSRVNQLRANLDKVIHERRRLIPRRPNSNWTRQQDIQKASAMLQEAQQAWMLKRNGNRPEDIAEASAAVEASLAAEMVIQRQIDELRIVAPVEGTVEALELQSGDLVAASVPVISIVDTSDLWIRAYVPESRLRLQVGDEIPVRIDNYPNEQFPGCVTFIARQAEFTPRNVQTPEDRSQQVFRIKVALLDGLDRLRPGMSGDVVLDGAPADE